jgi:hypothetical protein
VIDIIVPIRRPGRKRIGVGQPKSDAMVSRAVCYVALYAFSRLSLVPRLPRTIAVRDPQVVLAARSWRTARFQCA